MSPQSRDLFGKAMESLRYLQMKLPPGLLNPLVGIICGSGLNGLADTVEPTTHVAIPYQSIPYFPRSTGKS